MKKDYLHLLLIAVMLCLGLSSMRAEQVSVTLTEAGTISSFIPADQKLTITDLKVSGPINGTDVAYIRAMAGMDSSGSTHGQLVNLDLSDANIVSGGTQYSSGYGTSDNVVGSYMFSDINLVTLELPSTITSIGSSAFDNSRNLTSLNIPNSVESIGEYSFRYCGSLKSITLPSSVTSIPGHAFQYCNKLESVSMEGVKSIGDYAFDQCKSLKSISLDNVTSFGESSFSECESLTSVTISDAVTELPESLFASCRSLKTVQFGNKVTTIGTACFKNCALEEILWGESIEEIGSNAFSNCTYLKEVIMPNSVTTVNQDAFEFCVSLTKVKISDNVQYIDEGVFDGCSSLENLEYPESLLGVSINGLAGTKISKLDMTNFKVLNYHALANSAITEAVLPESLEEYDEGIFTGCTKLKSVTIPTSMTSIPSELLSGCTSLESITYRAETMPTMGSNVFYAVPSSCVAYVKGSLLDSYAADSQWSKLTLKDCDMVTVTVSTPGSIADDFAKIDGADKMNTSSLKVIGNINGTDIKYIREMAGRDSSDSSTEGKLTNLDLSEANIVEGGDAYLTTSIDSYKTENNVLGEKMMAGLKLTSLTLPNSLTKIADFSVAGSSTLTTVKMGNNVTSIGTQAFTGSQSLASINLSEALEEIGSNAFFYCKALSSITIPDNVKTISDDAFQMCSALKTVTIGSGVTSIGETAFGDDTAIEEITCNAEAVPTLGSDVFSGITQSNVVLYVPLAAVDAYAAADQWKEFTILQQGQVTVTMTEAGTIADQIGDTKKLLIKDLKVIGDINGTDIKYIREMAGSDSDGLETNGKLTTLDLSEANIVAGGDAYLFSYTTSDNVVGNYLFEYTKLITLILPNSATSIADQAFQQLSTLTTVTLGSGIASIGEDAFSACSGLTTVNLGDNLTSIGDYAFQECISLTSIKLPGSVTSIGDKAFMDCTSLTTVSLDDNLTSIGNYAFKECTSLTSIKLPSSVTDLGNQIFMGCTSLATAELADGMTEIGKYMFYYCTALSSVTIPNTVTTINEAAFAACTSLASITLPESLTTIKEYAFYQCTGLKAITCLAESVPSASEEAFAEVTTSSITVTVPAGTSEAYKADETWSQFNIVEAKSELLALTVTMTEAGTIAEQIGDAQKMAVTSLKVIGDVNGTDIKYIREMAGKTAAGESTTGKLVELDLSEANIVEGGDAYVANDSYQYTTSNNVFGQDMFSNTNLTSLTLPNSVTKIADDAVAGCKSLKTVVMGDKVTSIGKGAFENCPFSSINLSAALESIDDYAFTACEALESITIPDNVKTIGNQVFFACSALKNVTIGSGVTSIGNMAFGDETAVEAITCRAWAVPTLGTDVFSGMTQSSVTLTVPAGTSDAYKAADQWKEFNIVEAEAEPLALTVTMTEAGTIADQIGDAKKMYVTSLKVIGDVNGTDIKYIREMAGRNAAEESTEGRLVELDLSEANIVEGGEEYLSNDYEHYTTENNVLGYSMFCNTNLTTLIIPNSVTKIDKFAAAHTETLTTVKMGDKVTSIADNAFENDSALSSFNLSEALEEIGAAAFARCAETSITIPDNVKTIGRNAFMYNSALKNVTIGSGVTSIANYAFNSDTAIESIMCLAETVPTLGTNVFMNMTPSNVKLIVPDDLADAYRAADQWKEFNIVELGPVTVTMTSAGTLADQIDSALKMGIKSLKIIGDINGADIKYIREMAGLDIDGNATTGHLVNLDLSEANIVESDDAYYVKDGTSYTSTANAVGDYMFDGLKFSSLVLPTSLESIGNYAIAGCQNLTSVDIPATVTSIGEGAFSETGLTSVVIPDGVTTLNGTFKGCQNLTSVKLGSSVETITAFAFGTCRSLKTITIPDNVKTIGNSAFYGCSALESVFVGTGVNKIQEFAFEDCTSLKTFVIGATTTPTLGIDVFEGVDTSAATLYVPTGMADTYRNADAQWASFGDIIDNITSGIDGVSANGAVEVARYDINGRQLAEPTNGVNFVRMSDGTVRKEIVVK